MAIFVAAALASTIESTMSLGPMAVPAAATPGRLVSVASSFGSGDATKPYWSQIHVDEPSRVVAGLQSHRQDDKVVDRFGGAAVALDHLDAQLEIAVRLLLDAGHLRLDEVDAHRPGGLVELLVALAEGADVHVVDGDVRQRQRAGEQHRLLDRVHAADPRAVRHAERLVARAGALDVGDAVGDLPVRRPQHASVGAVGGEQPLHVQAADDVGRACRPGTPSWRRAASSRSRWR